MIKKIYILFFCILYSNSGINKDIYSNHMELFIHENILNEFLLSIGEIEGSGNIGLFDYNWNVYDLRVDINKDSSIFNGLVKLKSGSFEREDIIVGDVTISYNKDKNLIYVQISNIKIDIDLSDVLSILPKNSFMINIDISNYFLEPFEIDAPQPKEISYSLPLSNKKERLILINLKESNLILVNNGIKIISLYECVNK
jgi:hypothetical protein